MRRILTILFVAAFLFPTLALAGPVYVGSGDFTGSRWLGNGISANPSSVWQQEGFRVDWEITAEAGGWFKYSYTFTVGNPSNYQGAISHIIIEVSKDDYYSGDFSSFSPSPEGGGAATWTANGSNPAMPDPPGEIYGFKVNYTNQNPVTFTFLSLRMPVWGDFYSKDGKVGNNAWNAVWNTGFGTDPSSTEIDFTNWIATPDTVGMTNVPEPGTLLLLGSGLFGVCLLTRRFKR